MKKEKTDYVMPGSRFDDSGWKDTRTFYINAFLKKELVGDYEDIFEGWLRGKNEVEHLHYDLFEEGYKDDPELPFCLITMITGGSGWKKAFEFLQEHLDDITAVVCNDENGHWYNYRSGKFRHMSETLK